MCTRQSTAFVIVIAPAAIHEWGPMGGCIDNRAQFSFEKNQTAQTVIGNIDFLRIVVSLGATSEWTACAKLRFSLLISVKRR